MRRLRLCCFLLCIGSISLLAQTETDRQLLQSAHQLLLDCRLSYNLNLPYIRSILKQSEAKINQISDINTYLANEPGIVYKVNAEDLYLRFVMEQVRPDPSRDSLYFYLDYAYGSVLLSEAGFRDAPDLYPRYQIGLQDILSLKELITSACLEDENYRGILIKNHRHGSRKDASPTIKNRLDPEFNEFDSRSLDEFIPYQYSRRTEYLLPEITELMNRSPKRLEEIHSWLTKPLKEAGYDEFQYFSYKGGFVVVTELERINKDASPKPAASRWSVSTQFTEWSLWNYLRALFTAYPAYYRVMAFVITNESVKARKYPKLNDFLKVSGDNILPPDLLNMPVDNHNVTVLIYEFEQRSDGKGPTLIKRSNWPARTHLKQSGVLFD